MTNAALTALGIGAGTTPAASPSGAAQSGDAGGFADTLNKLVENAEATGEQANGAVTGMLDKSVDVHDAMIALQRADLSLQLAVQVRNKLVQAYQDIMRMPV